jgi:hypothetical protein
VVGRLAAARACDSIPACSDDMFQCQALTATASPGPALLAAELAAAAAAPYPPGDIRERVFYPGVANDARNPPDQSSSTHATKTPRDQHVFPRRGGRSTHLALPQVVLGWPGSMTNPTLAFAADRPR